MGDGAFSNVYKAVDRKTGQKVAVKVVRKYELSSSQVRPNLFVHAKFIFNPHSPHVDSRPLGCLSCPGQVWDSGNLEGSSNYSFHFSLSLLFLLEGH